MLTSSVSDLCHRVHPSANAPACQANRAHHTGGAEAQFSVEGRGSLGLRQRGVLERQPWRLTKSRWRKVPPKNP